VCKGSGKNYAEHGRSSLLDLGSQHSRMRSVYSPDYWVLYILTTSGQLFLSNGCQVELSRCTRSYSACFLIFTFTFVSRESAVENTRIESERRLYQTIRTMPPRGFVAEFARYHEQCFKAVRALERTPEARRNQVVEVIRLILWSIASLARKYDAAIDATYGANVMLYFESPGKWTEYSGQGRFSSPNALR
jgi:hypothetical protein